MAICAWLAGDRTDAASVQRVTDVCEGFLCPSLGTSSDYCRWFTDAGLVMEQDLDWTSRVMQTWEICERRVRRSGIRYLARLIDRDTSLFLNRFNTILEAYREGSMNYGCFIARKPFDMSSPPNVVPRERPIHRVAGIALGVTIHLLFAVTVWYVYHFFWSTPGTSSANAILIDVLLALQFGISHSVFLCPPVRKRLGRWISRSFMDAAFA